MTSFKRPLEMELATQSRTSPTGHHNLSPPSNLHKRRCTNYLSSPHRFEHGNSQYQNQNQQPHNQQQNQQHQQNHPHHQHHQSSQVESCSNSGDNNHDSGNVNGDIHASGCNTSGSPFNSSNLLHIDADLASLVRDELQRRAHDSHLNRNDPPILSIRQTQTIFEKLIKHREHRLREEYDKILINKLAEQHDTFVKYTRDHIERRYNQSHQASYLS